MTSDAFWTSWLLIKVLLTCLFASILLLARTICARNHRCELAKNLECYAWGPAYPYIDPIYGCDYLWENARNIFAHRFAQGVRERFQKYGPTYYSRAAFQNVIHTIDPRNLEVVMGSKNHHYDIIPHRRKLFRLLFGDGIFTYNGPEWKRSRHLVKGSITTLKIDMALLEKHSLILVENIRNIANATPNKAIDFVALANTYNFNAAAGFVFGKLSNEVPDDKSQFAADFARLNDMGQQMTIFIRENINIFFAKRITAAQERIFTFVDDCIERAMSLPKRETLMEKHDSVVEGLAAREKNIDRVRGETLNLFLAGYDTVRIGFTEMFWHLVRSPESWRKLRAEIAHLENRAPTLDEVKSFPYLKNIIYEASRLSPLLAVHGRKALKDTTIPFGGGPDGEGPLLVEKGTYIAYSNYALHRNPAVFGEDVDSFRPERWENLKPGNYEYLGFGHGPRACPGQDIGRVIVAFATIRLAQAFESLRPFDPEEKWEEAGSFSFYNRHGVKILATPDEKFEVKGDVASVPAGMDGMEDVVVKDGEFKLPIGE